MKTFNILVVTLAIAFTPSAKADILDDYCLVIANMAAETMDLRQSNISMSHMIDSLTDMHNNGNLSDEFEYTARKMIIDAFEYSDFSEWPKKAENTTREFSNKWMASCYRKAGK